MKQKITSRKLWCAVIAAALSTVGVELGLDATAADDVVKLALGYMLAQGAVDFAAARNEIRNPKSEI